MKTIKVGSDFSGVGAFNQALTRLGIEYQEVYACDMDKYARQTFIHNYGEPKYYPLNVYDREIPSESLDIYMTSPPCQAFSMAGKRLGKEDKRGILFFNSLEFIQVNKPRFFIFENVKGLLSDDGGKTFSEWVILLGGKSVNGNPVIFAYDDSVPYHLYWQVLNAKEHGVPQNRDRVFLIGIRDDQDNKFQFPKEEHLVKRLKDVLENNVADKYFLSEKMLVHLNKHNRSVPFINENTINVRTITSNYSKQSSDLEYLKIGTWQTHNDGQGFREIEDGNCPTIPARARQDGSGQPVIIQLNQNKESGGVQPYQQNRIFDVNGISPAILANLGGDRNHNILYNDKRLNQTIEKNNLPIGEVKAIDTYNKTISDLCPTLKEPHHNDRRLWDGYKVRRLTPRECFRLMDFPDTFTWPVSDSQAYKQAGNSIVVRVLEKIIKNLPL